MTWDEAKEYIKGLSMLEKDWDSYGANAIPQGVIDRASLLCDWLPRFGMEPPHHVCPTNSPGVGFMWGDENVLIEIRDDGGPHVFSEDPIFGFIEKD